MHLVLHPTEATGAKSLKLSRIRARKTSVDLELPRARRLRGGFRQPDRKGAVLELRLGAVGIDATRQGYHALEGSEGPLDVVTALLLLLRLELLLAAQDQELVLDQDLDILALEARKLGRDAQRLAVVHHVDARLEGAGAEIAEPALDRREAAERIAKELAHHAYRI